VGWKQSYIHALTCNSSVLQSTFLPCTLLKPCLCLCLCCHRSVPVRCTVHSRAREYVLVHVNRMLAIPGKDAKEGGSGKSRSQAVRCDSQPRRAGSEMYITGAPSALRGSESGRAQACWYLCWRGSSSRRALACRAHKVQTGDRAAADGRIARHDNARSHPTLSGTLRQRHGHARLRYTESKRRLERRGSTRGATTRGARGGYSDTGSTG
jgi:hypothetical protein